MTNKTAKDLMNFINKSYSMFHAIENIKKVLLDNNFKRLNENEKWILNKSEKYFVEKNNSAIIAFETGIDEIEETGFRITGAHVDSPCFKIKPNPEINVEDKYIKLNTEVYGGPIFSTWFDRPLAIAGKVIVKDKNIFKPKTLLLNIDKPMLIIPNLAIHFNRELNSGYNFNLQNDLLPLLALINEEMEKDNILLNLISKELNISIDDILDFELYLYEYAKGEFLGLNNEFISIGKLDDLWMCFSTLQGMLNSSKTLFTKVALFLNNEEIGNKTAEGSESDFVYRTLKRISLGLNKNEEEFYRSLSTSIIISADLAHGIHPNYKEKSDPTNKPILGNGPVLKYSARKSYGTDGYSASVFKGLCKYYNIQYQEFVNRSDSLGGSTMGPSFNTRLAIPVVDMGGAILSMHSIRELVAVKDIQSMEKFFTIFFSHEDKESIVKLPTDKLKKLHKDLTT